LSAIVVCSGKGSPGGTFVAVNLAAASARTKEQVLLLDLDPAGGDLGCYLGLDSRRGLYPLLRMEGQVFGNARLVAEAQEVAGFEVVCGLPEPSDLASPDVLAGALDAAIASGRTVIADIGRICETNASIASRAGLVLLVVRADLPSVLGAERALRQLDAAGTARYRIATVVSAHERRRPGDLAEVEEALRLPVLGAVPLDRRAARKALISQAPVVGRRLRGTFDAMSAAARRRLADVEHATELLPQPELSEASA
jgi:MinD-like ATPase involved in chromosome partitioning or flagellar assembly